MRCDKCGRFASCVWANPPHSVERRACEECYSRNLGLVRRRA